VIDKLTRRPDSYERSGLQTQGHSPIVDMNHS